MDPADRDGLAKITRLEPPALFGPRGEPCSLVGRYSGGCFLVGNGPSLLEHDIRMLGRPGICSFSLNNGIATLYANGVQPTFWGCVDEAARFVRQVWFNPALIKIIPCCLIDSPLWDNEEWRPLDAIPKNCPNTWFYRRDDQFVPGKFLEGNEINWGCSSIYGGCRTVMLAALRIMHLLGFSKVYMVGVDLRMDADKPYHFHEGRTAKALSNNENTFARLVSDYLPAIVEEGRNRNFRLYTCQEDSRAGCLEHMQFSDAIGECEREAGGPFVTVSTSGMYLKRGIKQRITREEAERRTRGH